MRNNNVSMHDDVMTYKRFLHYWPTNGWCVVYDGFFVVSQNVLLNQQKSCQWYEMPWPSFDGVKIYANMTSLRSNTGYHIETWWHIHAFVNELIYTAPIHHLNQSRFFCQLDVCQLNLQEQDLNQRIAIFIDENVFQSTMLYCYNAVNFPQKISQ